MKHQLLAIATLVLLALPAAAAPPSTPAATTSKPPLGDVATTWPGVHYQMTVLRRIAPGRLLVAVRIVATAQTPPPGVGIFLPNPAKPPKDMSPKMVALMYPPLPFSLEPTVMTDELSKIEYSTLSPVAPPGREYRPGRIRISLPPGGSVALTLQFPIPPPPPPGTPAQQQTLSFLFPRALGPMANIPIPPPLAPADPKR